MKSSSRFVPRRGITTGAGPTRSAWRLSLPCCLALLLIAATARAEEQWYVVLLEGQRAGHVHQTQTEADGRITTATTMRLSLGRGAAVIDLDLGSTFVETADGEPVSATSSLNLGGSPIRTSMTFLGNRVEVVTEQAGRENKAVQRPPAGDWLTPAAASRYVEAQLESGAGTITVTTIDPTMGLTPFTTTMSVVGQEEIEVFGRVVEATAWDATVSNLPGITMREYVDAEGTPLKSTVSPMPGMELAVLAADRDLALSPVDPPELMADTLIEPVGEKITRPREATRARYVVTGLPNSFALESKSDAQTVGLLAEPAAFWHPEAAADLLAGEAERSGDAHGIDVFISPGTFPALDPGQPPDERHERSSVMLDHEDPVVVALRDEAIATLRSTDPAVVAERLRRFVHDTIESKNLAVGFATASEVARTKQGDCTEHAVLLAALLRSAGIPARGVSGLVYADQFLGHRGVFGYHMWTHAWLDPDGEAGPQPPRWVDLDATLGPDTPFDATHIALHVTDLNDPAIVNDMVRLAPLIGGLRVKVVEVGYE